MKKVVGILFEAMNPTMNVQLITTAEWVERLKIYCVFSRKMAWNRYWDRQVQRVDEMIYWSTGSIIVVAYIIQNYCERKGI